MFRHRPVRLLAAAALLLAVTAPATGDWLVTRDDARIETEGAWKVKGRQVIFTKKHGSLSALRLDDVDLEASEAATAAAVARAAAGDEAAVEVERDPVERKPVLVLTDRDIPRATVGEESSADGEAATEGDAAAPAAPQSEAPVELVSWKANPSRQIDGLELVGAVRNNGDEVAAKVTVKVTIPDGEGGTLYETNAFLRSTGLPPGGSTTFRALLPGIFQLIEEPVFQVTAGSITLLGRTGLPPEGAEEGEDGGS